MTAPTPEPALDRATVLAGSAVALVMIAGFVLLAATGRPTSGFATFAGGPIVSTIVGALLARKVGAVRAISEVVQHQTNAMLTARLDSLDTQLASASDVAAQTLDATLPAAHSPSG